jgi:hypothetical protein
MTGPRGSSTTNSRNGRSPASDHRADAAHAVARPVGEMHGEA